MGRQHNRFGHTRRQDVWGGVLASVPEQYRRGLLGFSLEVYVSNVLLACRVF